MDFNTFFKAYALWEAENSSGVSLMISDINHDNTITEATMDAQVEYRKDIGNTTLEPIDKPAAITWSAIEAYKTAAEAVADYSN